MSVYAIGDVQGCHAELCDLLAHIGFSAREDRILLVGDLVNRGPDSLSVLREVRNLGDAAVTVLGNHDLHLLIVARGHAPLRKGDTLQSVLDARDRDELLDWLRFRPLLATEGQHLLVHAGLLPAWDAAKAADLAREVETVLRGPNAGGFLAALYGDEPRRWRDDLAGQDRLRAIVNAMTRMRFCREDGEMEFREKRGAAFAPAGFRPWFDHPHRASAAVHVICGHWSTLGLYLAPNVSMLDTGCVWGGSLTALRLGDRRIFTVPSRQPRPSSLSE